MRKTFLILTLTALTIIASASDAFAQRRGGGGGGGRRSGGVSVSVNSGYRGGYYGGYRGGYYYGGYYSPYYYGRSYYYTPSYYYSTPVYSTPVVVPTTEVRQSFYNTPAATQETATVRVLVPVPNAQVWFDGTPTNQGGMERTFQTPPLDPNGTYSYMVRARWTQNGQAVDRQQRITVQPGQAHSVDFRAGSTGEILPPPK